MSRQRSIASPKNDQVSSARTFIAEHGPGNRSGTIGYRVSVVRLADDHRTALGYAAFAQGWYGNGQAWGPAGRHPGSTRRLSHGLRRPGRENLSDPVRA